MRVPAALLLPGGQGRGSGEQALPLPQVRGAGGPVTVELVVHEPGGVLLLGQHCRTSSLTPEKACFFCGFFRLFFADLSKKSHVVSI